MPEVTVAGQGSFIVKDWMPLLLKATKYALNTPGFPSLGRLAAGAQLQREGFGFFQPFQLFPEGQAAVKQAVEFPTALGGAPMPVWFHVKLHHGFRITAVAASIT
jgi:hypothetical protein